MCGGFEAWGVSRARSRTTLTPRAEGSGSMSVGQRPPDVDPDPSQRPQGVAAGEDDEGQYEVIRVEELAEHDRLDGRHEAGHHVHRSGEHAGIVLADFGG